MTNGKNKKSILILVGSFASLVIVFVVLLLAVGYSFNRTLGWFAANKQVTADDMSVTIYDFSTFEIYVANDDMTEFANNDDFLTHLNNHENAFRQNITSNTRVGALCQMKSEVVSSEIDDDGISPGSYGTITFDIIPKAELTSVTFDISYFGLFGTNSGVADIAPDSLAGGMLLGHLLMFEDRTPISGSDGPYYYYSDRVNGTYTYTFGASPDFTDSYGEHYTVTLYWVWPATFGQMIFNDGDARLHSRSIFSPSDTTNSSELQTYIIANNEYFLYNSGETLIPFLGTDHADFELNYADLSGEYNEGDQLIGESVRYVAVLFEATANE